MYTDAMAAMKVQSPETPRILKYAYQRDKPDQNEHKDLTETHFAEICAFVLEKKSKIALRCKNPFLKK